jgi:hypothetical protein
VPTCAGLVKIGLPPRGLADVRPTPRRARSVAGLVKIGRHSGALPGFRLAAGQRRASGRHSGSVATLFYSARFRRNVGAPGFRPVADVRRQDRLAAVTIRPTFTTSAKVSAVFRVAKQTTALKQCKIELSGENNATQH